MNYKVAPGAALFLLPEPVTCFRSAAYNQVQTFHLSNTSSAVILDWITSGRKSLGEEWAFSRYYSVNDVWVDGKRVAKDVLLLDENSADVPILRFRTLQEKLAPYSCFAMVLLFGPLVQSMISSLTARYASIAVFKQARPEKLIWAISPTHTGSLTPGAVLRVAGVEAEDVKLWLKDALKQVEPLIGIDTYRRAFNS
ncbi:hypothetical protein ONZ45_g3025 [Pleurotus djamor]|nr:hypothetical protein ONZ45_g3025 [Pleurotus djamor]